MVSELFDVNVDIERIGFIFFDEDEDEEDEKELVDINLFKVRRVLINCIEELFVEYLGSVCEVKVEVYKLIVYDELL